MFVKKKIKKTLDKFLFSLYHSSLELLGIVSSSFLIGKGLGISENSRISLNSKTFVISVLSCQRLSLVVFSWSKDVGSVQVLRISLNSETFLNNPM